MAVPNHGVEGLVGDESAAVIERNGLGILPGDGECEGFET
jgi:hypothetical protein